MFIRKLELHIPNRYAMESYWSQKPQKQQSQQLPQFSPDSVDHCSDSSSMLTCSNTGREMVENRIFIYSLFVGDFRKEVWRLLLALVQVERKVCENLIGLQGQTSCTLFRTGMRRMAYTSGQMRTAYISGQMRTAYTSGDKMAFTHPDK